MPKKLDLTGKKFGKLTVIKESEKRSGGHVCWLCKCDCGNPKLVCVTSTHLTSGHTQSCGCIQKKIAGSINFVDITGQRFGKLVAKERINSDSRGHALWRCQCDCGNETIVQGIYLRYGHTTSCGCGKSKGEEIISQILNQNNISFIKEKTFNTCRFNDTNALARFDFYINNQYIIEFDGAQHFEYDNSGWNDKNHFETTVAHDEYKNQWCKTNNIPLIRIPYNHLEFLDITDLLLETTKYRVV